MITKLASNQRQAETQSCDSPLPLTTPLITRNTVEVVRLVDREKSRWLAVKEREGWTRESWRHSINHPLESKGERETLLSDRELFCLPLPLQR